LLFQDRSGTQSYYVTDNLGSTRALTNAVGAVTDTVTYDAYGNIIGGTQVTINEFLFTGQQFDAAVGQYYLRARYYDQLAGRFDERDPLWGRAPRPMTLHRYLYARADPVSLVDPSGMVFILSDWDTGDAVHNFVGSDFEMSGA
jgi:RHS repeat-associated protein